MPKQNSSDGGLIMWFPLPEDGFVLMKNTDYNGFRGASACGFRGGGLYCNGFRGEPRTNADFVRTNPIRVNQRCRSGDMIMLIILILQE